LGKDKDEEIEDDDDASVTEYAEGDLSLHDSFRDDVDELLAIKEALSSISAVDANYY
jgi:hypothetical protein